MDFDRHRGLARRKRQREGQRCAGRRRQFAQYLSDERHVETGIDIPVDFGDIALLLHSVQTGGTAFFTALASVPQEAHAASAREGTVRAAAAAASASAGVGLPATSTFPPVRIYSARTSASYTDGMTVPLPSPGASNLYEVVNGAWQLIPTTANGSNLTATLRPRRPRERRSMKRERRAADARWCVLPVACRPRGFGCGWVGVPLRLTRRRLLARFILYTNNQPQGRNY